MIAGAAVGHGLSNRPRRQMNAQEQAQASYFISLFSMLGKMAKADGRVSREEIELVESFMQHDLLLDTESREAAIKIFRASKDSPLPFHDFAGQFGQVFAGDRQMLLSMLDLLARLAACDDVLHPHERRLLSEAAVIFQLSPQEFRHVIGAHFDTSDAAWNTDPFTGGIPFDDPPRRGQQRRTAPPPRPIGSRRPYDVLGVEPTATMSEVKAAHRKLVTEVHPDKAIARGLPEELVKFAEKRFREVQEAYEMIQSERRAQEA